MRTFAIGDIHGCRHALDSVLELVRPQADDLVITLGDYVDRGPDSRGVLDRLLELSEHCALVALRGNHDVMMLNARDGRDLLGEWLQCGGRETLESYAVAGRPGTLDDIPEGHWAFLDATRPFCQTATHFFVHANVEPDTPLEEQPEHMLYWEKLAPSWAVPHGSGKTMVCGHTAQKSGLPLDLGHAVCIDTFVYGTGWLTCLDVDTGEYWQARQAGATRRGQLGGAPPE